MLAEIMNVAVEGLLATRQVRQDTLGAIREGVQASRHSWKEARQAEQAHMEEVRKVLLKSLVAGRAALKGEVAAIREEGSSALSEANQARSAGAQALRQRLQSQVSEEARQAQTLRKRSRQELADLSKQRAADGSSLREDLQASRARVQQEAGAAVGRAQDFMRDTSRNRAKGAEELRRNLQGVAGELRQGVNRERSALSADLSKARAEWQRTISVAEPTAPPVAPEAAAAAAVETSPEAATAEVSSELQKKVFRYLADHPDGIRLRELEERLSAGRFQMTRAIRTLMEEGKVRKEDTLYFAQ